MLLALEQLPHALLITREVEAFPISQRFKDGAVANARLINHLLPQWSITWHVVIPDVIHNGDILHIVEQPPLRSKTANTRFQNVTFGRIASGRGKRDDDAGSASTP